MNANRPKLTYEFLQGIQAAHEEQAPDLTPADLQFDPPPTQRNISAAIDRVRRHIELTQALAQPITAALSTSQHPHAVVPKQLVELLQHLPEASKQQPKMLTKAGLTLRWSSGHATLPIDLFLLPHYEPDSITSASLDGLELKTGATFQITTENGAQIAVPTQPLTQFVATRILIRQNTRFSGTLSKQRYCAEVLRRLRADVTPTIKVDKKQHHTPTVTLWLRTPKGDKALKQAAARVSRLTQHLQKLRALAESEHLRGQQWFATLSAQPNLKQLQIQRQLVRYRTEVDDARAHLWQTAKAVLYKKDVPAAPWSGPPSEGWPSPKRVSQVAQHSWNRAIHSFEQAWEGAQQTQTAASALGLEPCHKFEADTKPFRLQPELSLT